MEKHVDNGMESGVYKYIYIEYSRGYGTYACVYINMYIRIDVYRRLRD